MQKESELMKDNSTQIRSFFSRNHATVFPKLGVFLGGPTPPDGSMVKGWRRKIISKLKDDKRLNPSMIVVAPEPQSGFWSEIDNPFSSNELEVVLNKQMPWELQYLILCDITAFWMPTYWDSKESGNFAPNIGPTSRFELGYFFQEYLKNQQQKHFIIGSPEDAESIKWARKITEFHGIKWHWLKREEKSKLVADSFIEEIAQTLIQHQWNY